MMYTTSAVLLIVTLSGFGQSALNFGYDQDDVLNPENWSTRYKECAGKYQSPIDIEESLVTVVSLPKLIFTGFECLPQTGYIKNNGHTVLLQIKTNVPVQIQGGILEGLYTFEQLHFHWGADDSTGSEDLINHQSFPMELHMVYYKAEYGNFDEALNHKDGLTVLAVFFEKSEQDNKAYSELVDSLPSIEFPNSEKILPYLLPLEYYLPTDREHYFTYNGSLTTPPCKEVVTWIEFKNPVRLSHDQMAKFRALRSYTGYLTHNARPLQPLHGRRVYYNVRNNGSFVEISQLILVMNFLLIYTITGAVVST